MNVEIGTEAPLFTGKEYINGIFIAVRGLRNNAGDCYHPSPSMNACVPEELHNQEEFIITIYVF